MKVLFGFILLVFSLTSFSYCANKETNSSIVGSLENEANHDTNEIAAKRIQADKSHQKILSLKLPPYRTDTTSQNILLIGDSMSKWLRYRLKDYCIKNGHELSTVTWVSGNTEWFAQYDTLTYFIKEKEITYVFLVLGSNELFVRNFDKNRAHYVDTILNKLADVKWVWVGPPNWKKDKGINDCLFKKLSDKKFFLSKNLKFKRQKDGMHPTVSSCSMWVDSIVSWITNSSTSKIKLNIPDSSYRLKPDALVLMPL